MALEKIDKIKSISTKLQPQTRIQEPNKDYFDALMQQKRVTVDKAEGLTSDASEKAGAKTKEDKKE